MLIGIDASRANRKFKGGTEWYSFHLIRELAKIDKSNRYILYSDRPLEADLAAVVSASPNVKAKVLNWPFLYFWTQIRLSWEMIFHAPDVLFIPAHVLPVFHPKKSVVTIHDIGYERNRQLYSQDKIGPSGKAGSGFEFLARLFTRGKYGSSVLDYHSWSAKFALKHAKKIISVSEFTKKEMMEVYGASAEKIAVVHNGYNDKLYRRIEDKEKIATVLDKYGIKPPYVFYVGRLEKKKNTPVLVNAYALMRERHKDLPVQLVLAGSASLGFDEVKYMANEFRLENDIIMPGWIPEQDMPYLLSGADLFVFPSIYEGFGIPLLEAMACGVPVAASYAAAIPEVTGEAAMLFNPENKDDMAEKMAQVLKDKNLAEKLRKAGYKRVKKFSLDKCAKQTLAVIENL